MIVVMCLKVIIKGIIVCVVQIMPYFTLMNLDWNLKSLPKESKSGTTPTDVSERDILE